MQFSFEYCTDPMDHKSEKEHKAIVVEKDKIYRLFQFNSNKSDLFWSISNFLMEFWANEIDFVVTIRIRMTNSDQNSWINDDWNLIAVQILL